MRASDTWIGVIVGSGFEAAAYEVLDSLEPVDWPAPERGKWLAAIGMRTRFPADGFAAVCRAERNRFLRELDRMGADPSENFGSGIIRPGSFRWMFLARA